MDSYKETTAIIAATTTTAAAAAATATTTTNNDDNNANIDDDNNDTPCKSVLSLLKSSCLGRDSFMKNSKSLLSFIRTSSSSPSPPSSSALTAIAAATVATTSSSSSSSATTTSASAASSLSSLRLSSPPTTATKITSLKATVSTSSLPLINANHSSQKFAKSNSYNHDNDNIYNDDDCGGGGTDNDDGSVGDDDDDEDGDDNDGGGGVEKAGDDDDDDVSSLVVLVCSSTNAAKSDSVIPHNLNNNNINNNNVNNNNNNINNNSNNIISNNIISNNNSNNNNISNNNNSICNIYKNDISASKSKNAKMKSRKCKEKNDTDTKLAAGKKLPHINNNIGVSINIDDNNNNNINIIINNNKTNSSVTTTTTTLTTYIPTHAPTETTTNNTPTTSLTSNAITSITFTTSTTSATTTTTKSLYGPMAALKATSTPPNSPTTVRTGIRYKLITENDVQLCRLNHTKTVVSKIMNSKYLRRWEHHHLILGNSEIFSTSPSGFMESSIPYSSILDINVISRWDAGQKFCIRLTIADGSVLLQASNSYLRDQWLHSIQWKRYISKYDKLLRNTKRPDVLTKEIKQLIDLSLTTPIQDDSVNQFPLDLVSLLLKENADSINHVAYEQIIIALAPLLEKNHPTQQMCDFFTKHCKHSPRSRATVELFTPVIFRILKHNVDFGRYVRMQVFIQEYIQALRSQNGGSQIVREFIKSLHGPSTTCPHPRVLPNLVAVCFSTVFNYYEDRKKRTQSSSTPAAVGAATTTATNINEHISDDDDEDDGGCKYIGRNKIKKNHHHRCRHRHHHQRRLPDNDAADGGDDGNDDDERLLTYIDILRFMSEFDDWRLQLAILLQPIPFPDDALAHRLFTNRMKPLLHNLASDERCDVHSSILGLREEKAGWFDVYCPGGIASVPRYHVTAGIGSGMSGANSGNKNVNECSSGGSVCGVRDFRDEVVGDFDEEEEEEDDDELYTVMLMKLIRCCCRRKKFFYTHMKMISAWQLLAVRGNEAAIEALCLVLEFEICEKEDNKLQTIATLQNTSVGKKMYNELCQRQIQLQEIQQKGGPKRLTLPSRSTDDDLRRMLSSGAFGNLECLTLAFTQVTSACALDLIKLPSLRYLNLWSTQFGDTGLQVISEYMPKLQVLNLCETPVTDKGLSCLSAMRNLRKLNLNSTHLSAPTFQELKEKLPSLIECDVKYTDAW